MDSHRYVSTAILTFVLFLFAGCRMPPLMSYPWFWDYTRAKPKDLDLVGTYKALKLRVPDDLVGSVLKLPPSLRLNAEHSVVFDNFPIFDGFGDEVDCRLSGKAIWSFDRGVDQSWSLVFQNYHSFSTPVSHRCNHQNTTWDIQILGQGSPYRLYETVGDPDSDAGIEWQRASP
jgi:hypothetical protein